MESAKRARTTAYFFTLLRSAAGAEDPTAGFIEDIALVGIRYVERQDLADLRPDTFGQIGADHQTVTRNVAQNLQDVVGHQTGQLQQNVGAKERGENRFENEDAAA